MSEQNKNRPELIFEKMDVTNMNYKVENKKDSYCVTKIYFVLL